MTRRSRGVILAAGRGRRLGPLTDRVPKCLVRLGGRALLDWQLAALRQVGIDDIAVVGGYRAARLRRRRVVVLRNADWGRSNMVASLLCARAWLRSAPTLVGYGDIVYHPSLPAALLAADADVAIVYDRAWRALWDARFERAEDDAESLRVAAGAVRSIGGRVRSLARVQGQYIGLVRFTPRGWRRTERYLTSLDAATIRTLETTDLLARLVRDGMTVGAVPIDGRWCEVDTPRDLALYEARLASRTPWTHDWRFSE